MTISYGFNPDRSKEDMYSKAEVDELLEEIEENSGLLPATTTRLGGVKVDGVTIKATEDGMIYLGLQDAEEVRY